MLASETGFSSSQYFSSVLRKHTTYNGGIDPSANGARWIVTINRFAGLRIGEEGISLDPRLPKLCQSFRFGIQ